MPSPLSGTPRLRVAFAGTPEFAACHLEALIQSGHEICGVYTQPDRPSGRGKKLSASAVKTLALKHELPVFQPASLKDAAKQEEMRALDCDILVVVAYGLLLPQAVLDIPQFGCINVHGSILPKWRGAAPIQRAVEAGDQTTGVTIMQMDVGLDTGDMLLTQECPIHDDDTSGDIYQRLSDIGPGALVDVLRAMPEIQTSAKPQDNALSSYATKIEKAEAEIQWTLPATIIDRKVRAFNPFPICFTHLQQERLRIHKAKPHPGPNNGTPGTVIREGERLFVSCGEGRLEILRLQLPGKKAMDVEDFMNGFGNLLLTGTHLGQTEST